MSNWYGAFSFLFLTIFPLATGVELRAQTKPANTQTQNVRFTSGTNTLNVPFELSNNLVILQVRVNNSPPKHFLFDTGASVSVIDPRSAKRLHLKESGKLKLDATGGSVQGGVISGLSLAISGVEVRAQTLATIPLDSLSPLFGYRIEGIIGYDFIKNFVVEIDYVNSVLNFYGAQTYNYSGHGESVPITMIENTPFLQGKLLLANREPIEGKFELDTGANRTLNLNTPFVNKHKLLESLPNQMQSKLGGAGGTSAAIKARVNGVQVGSFVVKDPLVAFAQGTEGNEGSTESDGELGGAFFVGTKLVIDYSRSKIFIERSDSAPGVEDLSGLEIFAEGPHFKTFVVNEVTSNSPAAKAGLQEEDVIVAVNGRPAAMLTLRQLRYQFKAPGKRYNLRIKRGKKILTVEIHL